MARRLYIPVRSGGELVGWQGRHVGEDWKDRGAPKYLTMTGFAKSRVLYGGDAAVGKSIVIVEGASDVWAYGPGAVATFGKSVSREQLSLLGAWAARGGLAALMFDPGAWTEEVPANKRDVARAKRDALIHDLKAAFDGRVVAVDLPDGSDPGSLDRARLREMVRESAAAAGFDPDAHGL